MGDLVNNLKPVARDIKLLIEKSRQNVAVAVNAEITLLYWSIGKRINDEIIKNERAEYGKQVVSTLSAQLTHDVAKGWSPRHLFYCIKFSKIFADINILHTVCAKLSWSHFRLVIAIEEELKREFYIQLCIQEKWSVRQLQERIQSMLFERTAISKKPEETIKNDLDLLKNKQQLSPDLVFRDPYFLHFLGLADAYSEKDRFCRINCIKQLSMPEIAWTN